MLVLEIFQGNKSLGSVNVIADLRKFPATAAKNPGGWVSPRIPAAIATLKSVRGFDPAKGYIIKCTSRDKVNGSGQVYRTNVPCDVVVETGPAAKK